jgi:hypothetical protein
MEGAGACGEGGGMFRRGHVTFDFFLHVSQFLKFIGLPLLLCYILSQYHYP